MYNPLKDALEDTHMKGIIFDLDGTLLDSTSLWQDIDREFLGEHGYVPTEEYFKFVSNNPLEVCAVYTLEQYEIPMTAEQVAKAWLDKALYKYGHEVPLKPYVLDYLRQCRAEGISMAVATSCHRDLCDAALEGTGIREFFSCVVNVADVGKTKLSPDVYLEAARRMGLSPSDCTVIEDAPGVIDVVKGAGFRLIGMYDPSAEHGLEKMRACSDKFIYSFAELLR